MESVPKYFKLVFEVAANDTVNFEFVTKIDRVSAQDDLRDMHFYLANLKLAEKRVM